MSSEDYLPYRPIYLPSDVHPEPLSARIATSQPHNQLQSPLFGSLYPELRNLVFKHALTEYDDHSRSYSKHAYYYRPGFEFAGRIDTNLLLTCRLIYLETHLAPISLNEHVFWMYRGPPRNHVPSGDDEYFDNYFKRMTPQQRAAVRQVRFFTQLFWLEGRKAQVWPIGLAVPKLLITIRHADWWFWENGEDLRINEPALKWATWLESMPGLQEFELEFETIDPKREQLEERVRVALGWTFPTTNGGSLVHNGEEPVKSMWLGSSRMSPDNADEWDDDDDEWDDDDDEEEYESNSYDSSSDDSSEEDEYFDDEANKDVEPEGEEFTDNVTVELISDEESEEFGVTVAEDGSSQLGTVENTTVEVSQHSDQSIEGNTVTKEISSPKTLDPEEKLDLRFPMNLTLHVTKFKFIEENRLV